LAAPTAREALVIVAVSATEEGLAIAAAPEIEAA